VDSPLFGRLGSLSVKKEENLSAYRIIVEAKTEGIASALTHHRTERYLSEGEHRGGIYRTRRFRIERRSDRKRQIDEYLWDFSRRQVLKRKLRWKKGTLALYHNAVRGESLPGGTVQEYWAVGAEKAGGKIRIVTPSPGGQEREKRRLDVGKETGILYVVSPGRILGRKNRRLILAVDAEGVVRKAALSAIPVVGEIFVTLQNASE